MPANKFKDLTGRTINGFQVLGLAGHTSRQQPLWFVRDANGRERIMRKHHMTRLVDKPRRPYGSHGMCGSSEYGIWHSMILRCTNPKNPAYRYYGARGISVCQRWLESFENFYADMGPRPDGLSIDRENNDGNYEPANCRWATGEQQAANKRRRAA